MDLTKILPDGRNRHHRVGVIPYRTVGLNLALNEFSIAISRLNFPLNIKRKLAYSVIRPNFLRIQE